MSFLTCFHDLPWRLSQFRTPFLCSLNLSWWVQNLDPPNLHQRNKRSSDRIILIVPCWTIILLLSSQPWMSLTWKWSLILKSFIFKIWSFKLMVSTMVSAYTLWMKSILSWLCIFFIKQYSFDENMLWFLFHLCHLYHIAIEIPMDSIVEVFRSKKIHMFEVFLMWFQTSDHWYKYFTKL